MRKEHELEEWWHRPSFLYGAKKDKVSNGAEKVIKIEENTNDLEKGMTDNYLAELRCERDLS